MLKGTLLVIAPHADDESLGCGGLLSFRKQESWMGSVHLVLVSSSDVTIHQGKHDKPKHVYGSVRWREFCAVANSVGAEPICMELTTGRLQEAFRDIVTVLDDIIDLIKPEVILFPHINFHQDHRAVYQACFAALRPRNTPSVKRVITYEISNYPWAEETNVFVPNIYFRMDDALLESKLALCSIYESQNLHTKEGRLEVERMAIRRGAELECLPRNTQPVYAEAYRLIRAEL